MSRDDHTIELTTDCWICRKPMIRFAEDSWYWFYRCADCGTEKLYPKEKERLRIPEHPWMEEIA